MVLEVSKNFREGWLSFGNAFSVPMASFLSETKNYFIGKVVTDVDNAES